MENISEIEKKIIFKHDNLTKKRKNKYTEEDFKWWKYDDNETYFVLTTKRKNIYKTGE